VQPSPEINQNRAVRITQGFFGGTTGALAASAEAESSLIDQSLFVPVVRKQII
jgi:hypothetical protein